MNIEIKASESVTFSSYEILFVMLSVSCGLSL